MCGIAGMASLDGSPLGFEYILEALEAMRERGTEHGAGFAAYNPEPRGLVRTRVFLGASARSDSAIFRELVERLGDGSYREIARLGHDITVVEALLNDYPGGDYYNKLWFLQASRTLEVWKSIGWPREVADAYRVHGVVSRAWIGHTRYPTNSPGFKPWLAHPFSSGETVIVHNGDLSSYGSNKRMIAYNMGLYSFTGNDSEAIAFLIELLYRDGYSPSDVVNVMVHGKGARWARLDGPYAVIYIHGTPHGPYFSAFVDKHHFRPLYFARRENRVYVASEAAAVKAMDPAATPLMVRGGGYIVAYPDGELEVEGVVSWKSYPHPPPPTWAVDASKMNRVELNQALAEMLRKRGYAAAYNVNGHRYVANGLGPGKIEIWGIVGNASFNVVEGVEAYIYGSVQEDFGDSMTGSRIVVYGDVGDSAGQAMRSGELHVLGNAGNRLGIQMKGGVIVVRGDVGDYMAEFMAGGTIVVLGSAGRFLASGMVGGKIYVKGHLPVSHVGKAPPRRQVERYIRALASRGEISREQMIKALASQTVEELLEALGDKFKRLAKLWGVLHVGYPHVEYRYLREDEREELSRILESHVKTTRIPLDIEEALNHKYTIVTAVRLKPREGEGAW
ncbi:MAG: glutamate synthase [Hyperthermus sp.]|nr:MAG: glutamate synthase [Hyperthermus sp.]